MNEKILESYWETANYILERIKVKPKIAIILGSSLSHLADKVTDPVVIPYAEIPHSLRSTAPSHRGEVVCGMLDGKAVLFMSGRFHAYEGYDYTKLASAIRVLKLLGIEQLIQTNAAGAVNPDFNVGDIMIINDHIKISGSSPQIGPNIDEFGPRFYSMNDAYSKRLRNLAYKSARMLGQEDTTKEGVYYFSEGPQFETPAEVRAIRLLGGDAVGMSTAVETIVARHCDMEVLALSLMTNMAAGVHGKDITVDEVAETAERTKHTFSDLLCEIIKGM